jgi:MoxR-like ATPase
LPPLRRLGPKLTRLQCANFRPTPADLKPQTADGFDYAGFAPRPSASLIAVSGYVDAAISAGLLVWLHGPAGTGKSTAAKYAAERHAERAGLTGENTGGRTYFEVNCAGAMVSAVKGRDKLNSTVISDFMLAYEHGGTINLEEFDSAHPSVGTFLGTALGASDGFVNDMLERWVPRHKDFRCIVTANSLGYGSPEFKRQDLDAATKDRFRAGRVFTGLDLPLERTIVDSLVAKYAALAAA